MKAISLWQPWAGLIIMGYKTIETRTWSTNYRGELLIHAAKKFDEDAWSYVKNEFGIYNMIPNVYRVHGAILCKVNLVDCVKWELKHLSKSLCNAEGGYAWILQDVVPLETPIPWRGSQGFFNVELKLVTKLNKLTGVSRCLIDHK